MRTDKNIEMKKLVLCLMLLVTLFAAGCGAPAAPNTPSEPWQASDDVLRVHYIDVGQGDATFENSPALAGWSLPSFRACPGIQKSNMDSGTSPE
jgi:hypothetical protein